APPFGRATAAGNRHCARVVALEQVTYPLAHDPIVTGHQCGRVLEVAQQLIACLDDVAALVRDGVILEVGTPLAKTADRQAVILLYRADVETWQHPAAPNLEARLPILRVIENVSRINSRLVLVSGGSHQPLLCVTPVNRDAKARGQPQCKGPGESGTHTRI